MSALFFQPASIVRAVTTVVVAAATASLMLVAGCTPRESSASREPHERQESRPSARAAVDSLGAADGLGADDYGAPIDASRAARRIVSLNPTTTEILFALGAGRQVVGRSRWDQWPVEARTLPELGDAIRPSVERVLAATPDLVVLYASGDNRAAASALAAAGVRVVALRVDRIADFERCVRVLGAVSGHADAARLAIDSVTRSLESVRTAMRGLTRVSVFLHVWANPLMAIGGGSFMSELVEIAGGRNVYGEMAEPSPQVSFEDLLRRDPDAILAGPLEVARLTRDPRWRALRAVREGRVLAYDTSLVARASMRLGEGARSLATLLHPSARVP
ncbi:MAG: ABC transporter substrate-binding protein [Gemmatimonadaceae bacterium]|nr:ABC transporter substrate-binding protein [Gemmatimonadaceae bacterium]